MERDVDAFEEAHRLTAETIVAALGTELPAGSSGEPQPEPVEPPATEFGPQRPHARRKVAA